MSPSLRFPRFAWLFALVAALVFVAWSDVLRIQRVEYLSGLAADGAAPDSASSTGYADGKRWLIVPEHDNATYQWIQETEAMRAQGQWRLRRIDYENAPLGRQVASASPYRWWLLLVAAGAHAISGKPMALSIEQAALWANPLLQLLLIAAAAVFVARKFGPGPSALVALGLAAIYPLGAAFVPGVANDFGLTLICGFWSVLLLLPGLVSGPKASRWFFAAGVAGGIGLWVDAAQQTTVLEGIALGGILAALLARRSAAPGEPPPPWRAWAVGGALASLAAYLVEYFPAPLGLRLEVNHPLYALAWLGLGELLRRFALAVRPGAGPLRARGWIGLLVAAALAASLPILQARTGTWTLLALGNDAAASRLTDLPAGTAAASVRAWLGRDGLSGAAAATGLVLLLLAPAAWLLIRRGTSAAARSMLAVAAGAVLAALPHAAQRLRGWNTVDALLLVLAVAVAAATASAWARRLGCGLAMLVLALGAWQLRPPAGTARQNAFTTSEVEEFYERALAHWLADRAGPGGAVVLAPPYRTPSLDFYGNLRGLGTPNWENRDGLSATLRIVSSGRADEAQALVKQRGVGYLVIPSWDSDLDALARLGLAQPQQSFLYQLHRWTVFDWLCPVSYELPSLPGFEGQSVVVFQMTPEVSRATTISRLTEYLIEMQRPDLAAYGSRALRSYPSDLGALAAMAQTAKAEGDAAGFARVFRIITSDLAVRADRALPLDRRISLAVVLALGGRNDLARSQVQLCLAQLDEPGLRFLTTDSLYHFEVLAAGYGLRIADPRLNALAWKLLPEELRERLRSRVASGSPGERG